LEGRKKTHTLNKRIKGADINWKQEAGLVLPSMGVSKTFVERTEQRENLLDERPSTSRRTVTAPVCVQTKKKREHELGEKN